MDNIIVQYTKYHIIFRLIHKKRLKGENKIHIFVVKNNLKI